MITNHMRYELDQLRREELMQEADNYRLASNGSTMGVNLLAVIKKANAMFEGKSQYDGVDVSEPTMSELSTQTTFTV